MKIGDRVEWTSQAGGYRKTKQGEIVAVVPSNEDVIEFLRKTGLRCNSSCGYGMWRDHESYLVKIGNQAYWPRVKHLKLVQ